MTLEDLVRGYMNPKKGTSDDEVWVACPFCGDDKYRMGINVQSGLAHCFRASCEWKTSDRRHLFRELSAVLNITEKMDDARVKAVKKVPHGDGKRPTKAKIFLPIEYEPLPIKHYKMDDIERRASEYLYNRGIPDTQIKKHKLGFCDSGDYAWRIIIPVYKNKKLISFTGRDFSELPDIDPKYKNSPGEKFLYNVPRNKHRRCVLLEGPFDVLAVERATKDFDVLGRLGAGLTKSVLRELLDYDEIVLWPDPDRGGVDLAISAATALQTRKGRKVSIIMPHEDDTDPGKLGETKDGLEEIARKILHRAMWSDEVRMKLRHFAAFSCVSVRRDKNPAFL